jgi:hypothetical protein
MRNFEGTVRVRIHPEKGIMLDKGISGSTLTAADAAKVLAIAIREAESRKVGLDRWSFYLPGESQKVPMSVKQIPLTLIVEAIRAGATPTIRKGPWNSPRMVIAKDGEVKRESKIVDIA